MLLQGNRALRTQFLPSFTIGELLRWVGLCSPSWVEPPPFPFCESGCLIPPPPLLYAGRSKFPLEHYLASAIFSIPSRTLQLCYSHWVDPCTLTTTAFHCCLSKFSSPPLHLFVCDYPDSAWTVFTPFHRVPDNHLSSIPHPFAPLHVLFCLVHRVSCSLLPILVCDYFWAVQRIFVASSGILLSWDRAFVGFHSASVIPLSPTPSALLIKSANHVRRM